MKKTKSCICDNHVCYNSNIISFKNLLYLCIFLLFCRVPVYSQNASQLYTEQSPFELAEKIQGVYIFTPHVSANNKAVLVLSPVMTNDYIIYIDAVLITREDFFGGNTTHQWDKLILRGLCLYTDKGEEIGRFENDSFSKILLHDFCLNTDNSSFWVSYFEKK